MLYSSSVSGNDFDDIIFSGSIFLVLLFCPDESKAKNTKIVRMIVFILWLLTSRSKEIRRAELQAGQNIFQKSIVRNNY
ncbi:hypothetical protein DSECCO2_383520 [anaerobic digester metagenome]|jgi:hypothetical protein